MSLKNVFYKIIFSRNFNVLVENFYSKKSSKKSSLYVACKNGFKLFSRLLEHATCVLNFCIDHGSDQILLQVLSRKYFPNCLISHNIFTKIISHFNLFCINRWKQEAKWHARKFHFLLKYQISPARFLCVSIKRSLTSL